MADSSDELFYNNIICSSSFEESSDDESDILIATFLVNEPISRQLPLFIRSVPGRAAALDRDREGGHVQFTKITFIAQSNYS